MTELLTDWERFVHVHDQMPDLVQCAIIHEQFEAIHPFIDGNGRLGRLLIPLFLIGVTESAREGVQQAGELMDLRETYRSRLSGRARALALLDELFINPFVTVARAADRLGVSKPTAAQAIDLLVQNGMLQEITGRTWRRVYLAMPIMEAIQGRKGRNVGD